MELGHLLLHPLVLPIPAATAVTPLGERSQGLFFNNIYDTDNNKLRGGAPKFSFLPSLR
jgi:hypothetical protein